MIQHFINNLKRAFTPFNIHALPHHLIERGTAFIYWGRKRNMLNTSKDMPSSQGKKKEEEKNIEA
jgi:hypothetical protein